MKKIILTSAIIFATVAGAFAQAPTTPTSNATLNVILNPVQAIVVNTDNNNVTLTYATVEDYENGVKSNTLTDHLKVWSAGAFTVTAVAANLESTGESVADIEASTINIVTTEGTTPLDGFNTTSGKLNTAGLTVITSEVGGFGKTFNVVYEGGNNYINNRIEVGTPTKYTTTVTYTIAAK